MFHYGCNQKVWQGYRSLLLLGLLLTNICFGENLSFTLESAQVLKNLKCYQDQEKTLQLQVGDRKYLIEFNHLITTPIINSRITCQKFIQSLPSYLVKHRLDLNLELEPTKQLNHYSLVSTELVKICADLNLCHRDMIDLLLNQSKYLQCQLKRDWTEYLQLWTPSVKNIDYNIIKDVDLEIFPFKPFNEKLLDYRGGGDLYASTMTLGQKTVKRYYQEFKDQTKNQSVEQKDKLFILHDAGLIFARHEYHLLNSYFSKNSPLYSLPLTSGRYFDTIHHWKFLFNQEHPESSLSSMNLNSPEETSFIDAIYNFKNPEIKEELRQHFLKLAKVQCDHLGDLDCLSALVTRNKYQYQNIQKAIRRTCSQLDQPRVAQEDNYFLEPKKTDLKYIVNDLIKSAKKEIIIITHKFKLKDLYQQLLSAKEKGLKVYVFVTAPPPFEVEKDGITYVSKSKQLARDTPEPHLKAMLIDREKLWFGTGNFTYNAFNKASELYAVTDDSSAIKKILEVAAVLFSGFSREVNNSLGIASPQENWLYLSSEEAKEYLPYGEVREEYWLKKYLKLTPQIKSILKQCNLDHLIIINSKSFKQCLERIGPHA